MRNPKKQQRPVGRSITPERIEYRRRAEATEIGSVTRAQLAVLAKNLTCTGLINTIESHLLSIVINTATAESFQEFGRPIVFKSNRQLAFEICRSPSRVSRMLSRLFDLGLITMQDSGNYKRYPIRSGEGEIIDGCGIDLRILITRYDELHEVVNRARAARKAADAASRRFRGALRSSRLALTTAEGLAENDLRCIAGRIDRVSKVVGPVGKASGGKLRQGTHVLELLQERVMQLSRRQIERQESGKTTCTDVENGMHIQITNPDLFVESRNKRSSAGADQLNPHKAGSASNWALEETLTRGRNEIEGSGHLRDAMVSLHQVINALPALKIFGFEPKSWAELTKHVPLICRITGISDDARIGAIVQMGEPTTAVAVALTLEKYYRGEVSSPGGYLRGITKMAAAGKLNLARSLSGLAARGGDS